MQCIKYARASASERACAHCEADTEQLRQRHLPDGCPAACCSSVGHAQWCLLGLHQVATTRTH
jgi:hypothetical protein